MLPARWRARPLSRARPFALKAIDVVIERLGVIGGDLGSCLRLWVRRDNLDGAHAGLTTIGSPPWTRSDRLAPCHGTAGDELERNRRATMAATKVASIMPRWLPRRPSPGAEGM